MAKKASSASCTESIQFALELLDHHTAAHGVPVPARLRQFWKSGEILKVHGKCLPEKTVVPHCEPGSFRLGVAFPEFILHDSFAVTTTRKRTEEVNADNELFFGDDAWGHRFDFLPIFNNEGSQVVVRLDEKCSVGWLSWSDGPDEGKGYRDGVWTLASSLDAFLKTLIEVDEDEASFDCEIESLKEIEKGAKELRRTWNK